LGADLHGLINLDKPAGLTSAKAVYRIRSITRQRKSGHAGALDPAATGVLLICLGKATKLVERLMGLSKTYQATARLDITSESFDADRPLVPVEVTAVPSPDAVLAACQCFIGEIEQIPPRISALKVGGVPAYRRAARGQELELPARRVRIDQIEILRYEWPNLDFEVQCGRGTYIRALIRDIGQRLNTAGCLTSLRRTRIGPFRVEDAWPLEKLRQSNPPDYVIPRAAVEAQLIPPEPRS
jgi:tRNA pseudouridine55 synthase